jgi:hypothetical protein
MPAAGMLFTHERSYTRSRLVEFLKDRERFQLIYKESLRCWSEGRVIEEGPDVSGLCVRRIPVEEGKVSKPSLVVIMAVGNDQPLDLLQPVTANLLKQGRTAIDQIAGLPDSHLIADALPHPSWR